MSRKARRFLKIVAVAYFAAFLLFLLSFGKGRYKWRRPELIPAKLETPQPSGFTGNRAEEDFGKAKERVVACGFRLRAETAAVPALEVYDVIGTEELDALIEAKSPPLLVWDPRLIRAFAAKRVLAGEPLSDDLGNIVANTGDELNEDVLTRIALAHDQKQGAKARRERIWVKGRGSLVGLDLTLVFTMLNFLVLAGALYAFLWEPITRLLDDRAQSIRDDIEATRRGREEAEELRQVREAELGRLREDAERLRTEGRARGEAERARLVEDGRAEARRVAERQERAFAAEVESARKDAVSGLGGLSVELASKVLAREVSLADHERMVDGFVAKLAEESDKDAQD